MKTTSQLDRLYEKLGRVPTMEEILADNEELHYKLTKNLGRTPTDGELSEMYSREDCRVNVGIGAGAKIAIGVLSLGIAAGAAYAGGFFDWVAGKKKEHKHDVAKAPEPPAQLPPPVAHDEHGHEHHDHDNGQEPSALKDREYVFKDVSRGAITKFRQLAGVADRKGGSLQELQAVNPGIDLFNLAVGSAIKIPQSWPDVPGLYRQASAIALPSKNPLTSLLGVGDPRVGSASSDSTLRDLAKWHDDVENLQRERAKLPVPGESEEDAHKRELRNLQSEIDELKKSKGAQSPKIQDPAVDSVWGPVASPDPVQVSSPDLHGHGAGFLPGSGSHSSPHAAAQHVNGGRFEDADRKLAEAEAKNKALPAHGGGHSSAPGTQRQSIPLAHLLTNATDAFSVLATPQKDAKASAAPLLGLLGALGDIGVSGVQSEDPDEGA